MKPILTIFLTIFLTSFSNAQHNYSVVIDSKVYSLPEGDFNECYGKAFDRMIEQRVTEEKYFDLWTKTFSDWKDKIRYNDIVIETIGDRITKHYYLQSVESPYDGNGKNGSKAKGNIHNEQNISRRMAYLNYYFTAELVHKLTGRTVK